MRKLVCITWCFAEHQVWFLRGGNHPHVYLPRITDTLVYLAEERRKKTGRRSDVIGGWVRDVAYARIFEVPLVLTPRSFHPNFDKARFRITPYDDDVLPTQLFLPRAHWR